MAVDIQRSATVEHEGMLPLISRTFGSFSALLVKSVLSPLLHAVLISTIFAFFPHAIQGNDATSTAFASLVIGWTIGSTVSYLRTLLTLHNAGEGAEARGRRSILLVGGGWVSMPAYVFYAFLSAKWIPQMVQFVRSMF